MDKGKRTIREGETSQWIRENESQRRRDITLDKGKRKIREGETSQWIREKGQSEKERHHNG
jgi:hypothetical protein